MLDIHQEMAINDLKAHHKGMSFRLEAVEKKLARLSFRHNETLARLTRLMEATIESLEALKEK